MRCVVALLKKGGLRKRSDAVKELMRNGNGHSNKYSHVQFLFFSHQSSSRMCRSANLSKSSERTQERLQARGIQTKVAILRKKNHRQVHFHNLNDAMGMNYTMTKSVDDEGQRTVCSLVHAWWASERNSTMQCIQHSDRQQNIHDV